MRGSAAIILCYIFALSNHVYGARILGLFPHTGKSHQMFFEPLLRKLAEKGHHVTVGSFFPSKNPPDNYVDISFEGTADVRLESFDLNWYETFGWNSLPKIRNTMMLVTDLNSLSSMSVKTCSNVIKLPALNEALKREYDVVLLENFISDCMLGLIHVYGIKAPVVGLSSCVSMAWSAKRMGATDNPSYVPVGATAFTTKMTFLERVENTLWSIFLKFWFRYSVQIAEQAVLEKRFERKIPEYADLGRNISLMLVNTYHALQGSTPLVPGLVEVGGMHLDHKRKNIPQVNY